MAHGDAQLWESLGERRKLVERARRCVGVEDARSGADAMGELGMVCGGVASDKNRTAARMHEVGDVARRVARRGDGPERAIPEHVHDMIEGQHGFGVPEVDHVLRTAGEVIAGWALASAEYHRNAAVEIREPRSVVLVQVCQEDLVGRHAARAQLRGRVLTGALPGFDPDRRQQLIERSAIIASAGRERPRQTCVDEEVATARVMGKQSCQPYYAVRTYYPNASLLSIRMTQAHVRIEQLNLNLMLALHWLLVEQSVTRAARRMGVTQSAMSRSLGQLRVLLGDQLFVPVGRRLEPTRRATTLRRPLADAMDALRNILRERRAVRSDSTGWRVAIGRD